MFFYFLVGFSKISARNGTGIRTLLYTIHIEVNGSSASKPAYIYIDIYTHTHTRMYVHRKGKMEEKYV